jgi:uncharacterized protein
VQYRPTSRTEKAVFSCQFEQAVELIGSMRLKLWISTSEGDDLDLFVVLRELDSNGREAAVEVAVCANEIVAVMSVSKKANFFIGFLNSGERM